MQNRISPLLAVALVMILSACQGSIGEQNLSGIPGEADGGLEDLYPAGDGGLSTVDQGAFVAGDTSPVSTGGPEQCGNGLDDDGDGQVDEKCPCSSTKTPTQSCYGGAAVKAGVGICARGSQKCEIQGEFAQWGKCGGWVGPGIEDCVDGKDNDCNGKVDDAPHCKCKPGQKVACYTGPNHTRLKGICRDGYHMCNATGTAWSKGCHAQVLPGVENCHDGLDNDCNGKVDDAPNCKCKPGQKIACYQGPPHTRLKGICRDGYFQCNAAGTAWGTACVGQQLPMGEKCGDGKDNDCDGQVDEGCVVSVNVNLKGDCLTVSCPSHAPYPVGCNITMGGGDCRGCVASSATNKKVYFQEGDACGAGWVKGTLYCSSKPKSGLNSGNCKINKKKKYYPTSKSGCPKIGGGGDC